MSDTTTIDHASLAEALLAAQAEMPAVDRDGENPHFNSKFVTLDNLIAKTRPVLNRHGLVLIQAPASSDGQFVLRTTIMHSSGGELSFDAPLAPVKKDPQSQGSAITYMRRYALAAALAIADQDDNDGNEAEGPAGDGSIPSALTPGQVAHLAKGIDGAGLSLDALNITLGSLGIDAFDPLKDREEQLAALTVPQGKALNTALEGMEKTDADA